MTFEKQEMYLRAILEEGSITAAANRLFLSQPSLSIFLNKLEAQLGVSLFDKSQNPLQLTYAGQVYLSGISKLTKDEHALYRQLKEIADNTREEIVIGIGHSRGSYWMPKILTEFYIRCRNVDVKIIEGKTSEFERMLLDQKIDLAICSLPFQSPLIDYEVIFTETIFLAVNQGNPILEGLNLEGNNLKNLLLLDPARVNGQRFLSPSPGHGLYYCTQELMKKHNIHPSEIKEINNSDTAYLLACTGYGLVFTPDSSATFPYPAEPPVFCTLDDPPRAHPIVAAYNISRGYPAAANILIEIAKEVAEDLREDMVYHPERQ